jgi:protein O-GlcNAc transferase
MDKWITRLKNALGKPQTKDSTERQADAVPDGADRQQAAAREQRLGNDLLDQGKLHEALACYEKAVALNPSSAGFVSLGFALLELGRTALAQQQLTEALRLDKNQLDATYLLGVIARDAGDYSGAAKRFEHALTLQPDSLMVLQELCNVAFLGGDMARSRSAAEAGIAVQPDGAVFHHLLGSLLVNARDAQAAVSSLETALRLAPDNPETHYNLGLAQAMLRRMDEAKQSYLKALSLSPGYGPALNSLSALLTEQGLPLEAVEISKQALALNDQNAEAHNCMGNALLALGRHDEAIACYQRTLALRSDLAEAHNNMGLALMAKGALAQAIESLQRALALKPTYARGYNNLGNALQQQNRLEEAVQAYHRSFSLEPDFAQAHNNHAVALQAQGRHEQAVQSWRRALALEPDYLEAWSNMLYVLSFSTLLTPLEYLKEARAFGAAASARARPFTSWPRAPLKTLAACEPLRVGFVSGDLREHPVGFFLEGVLAHLDVSRITAVAYTTNPAEDVVTARIKPRFAQWHSLVGMNDEAAAAKIHGDGIHILVDLAGHSAHNRLPLFCWKAAPIQLSWLGFFASTGVPEMDYLIADETGVPEALKVNFSESIRYLQDTRLCFTEPPGGATLVPGPLPALKNGYTTFGCYQNMTKLNDEVLALWGKVFAAIPDARLRLQSRQMREPELRAELLGKLARNGIAGHRVTLADATSRALYFEAHREVDVMLDTFPYGGGTTTCESLWMGVPTITLAGDTLLARQGASLLTCAGLAPWVAQDADDYVNRVVAHCGNLQSLAELRARLRTQVLASPLFDTRLFAGRLRDLLHNVWKEKPP